MNSPRLLQRMLAAGVMPVVRVLLMIATVTVATVSIDATAQAVDARDVIQLGFGGLPGIGLQLGYIDAGPAFTREAVAYFDLTPRFRSNREALLVSAGLGAGVRIIGTLETLTLITPRAWDIHVGFRFGPGLSFSADETRGTKNQRFSLFLEPFARFATTFRGGGQTYFVEAGIHRPILRMGLWIGI